MEGLFPPSPVIAPLLFEQVVNQAAFHVGRPDYDRRELRELHWRTK